MTKFEKLSAKTIGTVKRVIENNYAIIVFEDSDWILNDKSDIYSLYDHDNLFIFRYGDNHYVGLFKSVYVKNPTCFIIHACIPDKFDLYEKAKSMKNYKEECSKVSDMFEKAKKYDEILKSNLNKKIVDDVFAAFGSDDYDKRDKKKKNKEKVDNDDDFSPLGITNDGLSFPFGILSKILRIDDNPENMKEVELKATDNIGRFIKTNKRFPTSEELLDMVLDNKEGLTKEEKQKMKKEFMNSPLFHIFDDDIK